MLGAIAVALLLSATSPAPSIVPTHEACTTLRENVRTALAGLMKNDEIIESGRKAYLKMSSDRAASARDVAIDRLYVENAVAALVHNLALVDDQLADPKRFPPDAAVEARSTSAMKAQLTAIAVQQKKALDLLSGALETGNFNTMQTPSDDNGPTIAHNRSSLSATPPEFQNPSVSMDMAAGTPDDAVADGLAALQAALQALESKAAMTVMSAAAACNGVSPP
jgi:hypothetical protein